jgi:hypothetical protein
MNLEKNCDAYIWTAQDILTGKTLILIEQEEDNGKLTDALVQELKKLGLEINVGTVPCG